MYNLSKSGKWWLPGKEEKQFYGELKFCQSEGGTLLLSDIMDKLYDFPVKNEDFILVGDLAEAEKDESKQYTKVSVWVGLVTSSQQRTTDSENSMKIVLRWKYIFLGVHVEVKT